ncbi:uncharacterized protein SCHCODRAFT_02552486, partial [Schizophyllum commune H4-8]|uniref:uncharacterized protein n=1 Tax=Schizophyllum commune (strain H4-8 / FGSC 9210) TaxID=578458 RepID=UPI00215FBB78
MELLGFAPEEVAWLRSFLSDREVMVRVDGHLCAPTPIAGVGIPQGSPLSPILSTIYTLPVLTCLDRNTHPDTDSKFYVDDGLL